jgi:hypothetical protein
MDRITYAKEKISEAEDHQTKVLKHFNEAEENFKKAEMEYRAAERAKEDARITLLGLHIKLHEFQMDVEKGRT